MGEGAGAVLGAEQSPAAQQVGSASAKATAPEVRFIRVYAPADRIGQWPWGEMKYVPVERAEFEQLIQGLEGADSRRPSPGGIQKARYTARFSEPAFLEGEATFQVHHAASPPAVLRWPRWRLAVRNAAWVDGEGKSVEPALLGLSETGQTELVVARSGQLRLDWSFQGRRESSGAVQCELGLPPCPHTELLLDLPDGFSPALEGALIRLEESASGPGRKSWLLEWGGPMPGVLRIAPPQSGGGPSAMMLVQQETQYRLSPEGLEGVVRFNALALAEPVSELSLLIDPGLEVVRVKLGEQEASWTMYQFGQTGQRRVVVRMPQPIRNEVQLLQVEVVGPVVLETAWRTPRLRMEGAVWQQGLWGVRILSPLAVQRLVPM
ncbi:MAG TPA: hypothetical protein PLQ00_17570, partial [Thermoguttaceae bacterium]|nr:hypothetical protein [Thermoguttaceae bacterium]